MVVFISHASVDKPLVSEFVDLLQTGINISADDIFCSTLEGLGIKRGANFIDFIKSKLSDSYFVIPILTPCYYESVFCTCELGATWALEQKNIYPLIVPPFQLDDGLKAVLNGIQSGEINDPDTLNELITQITAIGYGKMNVQRWDVKKNEFLATFDALPAVQQTTKVPRSDYEALERKYKGQVEVIRQKNLEVASLNSRIEDLEKLKDKEGVSEVRKKHLPIHDQFEAAVEKVKEAFGEVPSIVPEVLYYIQNGDGFGMPDPNIWSNVCADLQKCKHRQIFDIRDNNEVTIPYQPLALLQDVLDALEELQICMHKFHSETNFLKDFERQHKYRFDYSNLDFWKKYLDVYFHDFS